MYSAPVASEYNFEEHTFDFSPPDKSKVYRAIISRAYDDFRDIPAGVVIISSGSTQSLFSINFPSSSQVGRVPSISRLSSEQDLAWVGRVIELSRRADSEDMALKEISMATTAMKARSCREPLNIALRRFSQHDLSDIVCIALLRNTFSLRAELSQWYAFRDMVEIRLNNKNLNSKRLLRGLYV